MAVRKKEETLLMEAEAWRLRTKRGMTHQEITDEINRLHFADKPYARPSISRALNRTANRFVQERNGYIEQYKVEHTETLEHIAFDLLEAIEKSKGASKKAIRTTRKVPGKKDQPERSPYEETRIETEDRYLDVNLIKTLRETLSDIREIWGANAPVETIQTLRSGIVDGTTEIEELTDAQLHAIIAGKS